MSNRDIMLTPEVLQVPKIAEHGTHIFHRYVASFTPELVDVYLDRFAWKGAKVLDPFCGGGTTLVEACRVGCEATGVDLSPFAWFISRVKTTKIPDIAMFTDAFLDHLRENYQGVGLDKFGTTTQDNQTNLIKFKEQKYKLRGIADYFSPEIFEGLITIRQAIRDFCGYEKKEGLIWVRPVFEQFYDFLLCGFSNILRSCSGISSGSYMPYLKGRDELKAVSPWTEFPRQLTLMSRELEKFNEVQGFAKVLNGDARTLVPVPDNSINLVITSPPYGKAVAYEKVERFSFCFLELPHEKYSRSEIGRTEATPRKQFESETATITVNQMLAMKEAKGQSLARQYTAYFKDLEQVFSALKRVCKVGAVVVWVVGNNTLWETGSDHVSYGRKGGVQVKREGFNLIDNVQISREIAYANSFVHLKTTRIEGLVNPAFGRIENESAILLEREN